MHYFSIFFTKFKKLCVDFLRVWTKNPNCWEILRKFSKNLKIFLTQIVKNALFQHIFKKVNKQCVNFSRVLTKNTNCWEIFEKFLKIFDQNSIGKLNFYRFVEKLLLNTAPSEITSFFYNIFFRFGGGVPRSPTLATPLHSLATVDYLEERNCFPKGKCSDSPSKYLVAFRKKIF